MNGVYVYEAMATVIANAFSEKGAKAIKYRERPILAEMKEKNRVLTEEEKQLQIDALFGQLEVMQQNFMRTHGD